MMKFLLLPALLLLAACGGGGGGGGQSFMVEVDRPAHEVAADLSALDVGRQSDNAMHKTQVIRSQENPYSLDLRLVAPEENEYQFQGVEANFRFRLESLDGGRTRIAVTLDVPPVEYQAEKKYLSEAKVAKELRSALDTYAAAVSAGGEAGQAIASIDYLFAAVAFSMDQASMKNFASSQYGAADFSELVDSGEYDPDADMDSYAYEPEYGAPTDTTAPASDTAPTTDTAYSTDTTYEGDGGWATE